MSTSNMDKNKTSKKHSTIICSLDTTEKGNNGDARYKKLKSDNSTVNEWNDMEKHQNAWIVLKSCTGTCQYYKPTKSQMLLIATART